jgi:pimeloyl-ACP methyl ester carboxylesterase
VKTVRPGTPGVEHVQLKTRAGTIDCLYHVAPDGVAAVLWVGGAGGGLYGPANGLYPRLAGRLVDEHISSLRLDYRYPNHLDKCVHDTLRGVEYLGTRGRTRVVLVGHSFGGAVVITAGASSPAVVGVAALSSQTYGTSTAGGVAPRPLLLLHGMADAVLPDTCSRSIYRRAAEPKKLLLYPGCGHGLDECREQVDHDLLEWLREVLKPAAA